MTMSMWFCGLFCLLVIQSFGEGGAAASIQDWTDFAKCHNKFSLDLYKMASQDDSYGNIFFSPLSISFALGLLKLGARGSSLDQLSTALCLNPKLNDEFHCMHRHLAKLLDDSSKSYSLRVVNELFGDQAYKFLQDFIEKAKWYYNAELRQMNFVNDAEGARVLINQWVANHTNDKIKDLIPPNVLDTLTKLVLVNAVHFKGQWLHQFDRRLTKEKDFHMDSKMKTKTFFMNGKISEVEHAFASKLNAQVLELPFTEDLAFHVVLPNKGTSLKELESSLTYDLLQSLEFSQKSVTVCLPRFKLDLEFKLEDHLKDLGVVDMFSDEADLSGIDGTKQLHVSRALHKAYVDLNEEGAEAAAATAVIVSERSLIFHQEHIEFKADHPFIFYLKDLRTNLIYFMGRFVKP